ncbi:Helix-turn-helix domain protein [anaerobic digester metagenome]
MGEREKFKKMEQRSGWERPILTMREAAMFTGLSKNTLYKLIQADKIKHYRPNGKLVYFRRDELEAWLMKNPSGGDE